MTGWLPRYISSSVAAGEWGAQTTVKRANELWAERRLPPLLKVTPHARRSPLQRGAPPPGRRRREGTLIGTIVTSSGHKTDWPRYAVGVAGPDFDGDIERAAVGWPILHRGQ